MIYRTSDITQVFIKIKYSSTLKDKDNVDKLACFLCLSQR